MAERPGVGQFTYGWKASNLRSAEVETIPSNFGTTGSLADFRRRRTAVVIAPPDPRFKRYNGLIRVIFRNRVNDTDKIAAVYVPIAPTNTASLNFATPRGASLSKGL